MDNMDNKDNEELFSYSTDDNNNSENKAESFDLNSFSSDITSKNEKNEKKSTSTTKQKVLKTVLTVFLIGVITVSIVLGTFIVYVFTSVDGTMEEDLDDLKLNFTTTIYTKGENDTWTEYQRLHGEFNRIWTPYDSAKAKSKEEGYTGIPQNLVNSFVAIEDKRFYEHDGVDWKRTFSAFVNLFLHFYSSNQGGSTITQQLVKNLTGDNAQKPSRKMREIMRARYLESHYSKDTIVECYLNTIPLGHGTYGVEVAANYYFNKSVKDLTLAECATLAAITKSPTYYAPDDHSENNKDRKETVLKEMLDQDYITEEEYNNALKEEIKIVASRDAMKESEVNNYFVDALIVQVTKDIAEKYGYDESHAAKMFYSGGYKIYSSVNPDIQNAVDSVFNDSNTYGIKSKDGQQLQGAITVMDYQGHVLGLSGGIGEKTVNLGLTGFNRAINAIRQPGSTMKPIAAYAPAIEEGIINYSSTVNDQPVTSGSWTAVNWYKGYWGNISVPYALERSVNTIPVQLVKKLGTDKCFDFVTKNMGVTTLNPEDMNLAPLGMGGTNGGITTTESAAAYATFGNGGKYYKPKLYYYVCDQHDEKILGDTFENPTIAMGEDTATVMNHLLRNVVDGSQGTGAGARKYVPNMTLYAKTGTSNNSNDLWFVGGTPYYVASCWCGYDNQTAIRDSGIALKMWGAVAQKIHKGLEPKEFENSSYAEERYYCTSTGQLATSGCPSKSVGYYCKGKLPGACKSHGGNVLGSIAEEKAKEEKAKEEEEKKKQEEEKKKQEDNSSSQVANQHKIKPVWNFQTGFLCLIIRFSMLLRDLFLRLFLTG